MTTYLFVGGPWHGRIQGMAAGAPHTYRVAVPRWDDFDLHVDRVDYIGRKVAYRFPGRTDMQLFRVFDASGGNRAKLFDAIVAAWVTGWTPDGETP